MEDRRNHVVRGCIGPIRTVLPFTEQEVEQRTSQGLSTPLDLMPHSFWREPGSQFPRFSEEMLGAEF